MIVVELWEHNIAGLVVPQETGIRYDVQTGGHACHHPNAEGIFVPIVNPTASITLSGELTEHFCSSKHGGWCSVYKGKSDFDNQDADVVEEVLKNHAVNNVKVNRDILDQCEEAWVHVIWNDKKAMLTWENSD